FCQAIERPDLEGDERYATVFSRAQHSAELIALLDAIFATRNQAEWAARFDQHALVWGPVQGIGDVVHDPQAQEMGAFASEPHRTGEEIRLVKSPIEFSHSPSTIRRTAPELGEHTEEVLLEYGYTWEDIAMLKEKGAIG